MTSRLAPRSVALALAILLVPASAHATGQDDVPPPSDPPLVDVEDAAPLEEEASREDTDRREAPVAAVRHPGTLIAPGESPTVLARAELVGGQGVNGLAQAMLLCAAAQCGSSPQLFAGSAVLGAGLGVGLSAWITRDGISGGPAQVINSGAAWGAYQGTLLATMIAEAGDPLWKPWVTISLTGLAGTGVGTALAYWVQPSGGPVAMANSGGIWASVLTTLFLSPAFDYFRPDTVQTVNLVAANGGILLLGLVSRYAQLSRGRMFLIDAGGVLGLLLGFAAGTFAGLTETYPRAMGPVAAVGGIAGLAAAFAITIDLDEQTGIEVALLPMIGSGRRGDANGASLLVAF